MDSSDNKHPQFFKVFQPQNSSEKLMIPPAYEEKIPGKIPNKVVLRNRVGKIWVVNVGKIGDRLYFQEGWSKFVVENSLSYGEFMVFKYNGQRIFEVLLLGRHGCEKEVIEAGEEVEVERAVEEQLDNVDEDADDDDDDDEEEEEEEEEDENEELYNTKLRQLSAKKNLRKYMAKNGKDEHEDEDTHTGKFRKTLSNKIACKHVAREYEQDKGILKYLPKENPFFITRLKQPDLDHNRVLIPVGVVRDSNLKLSKTIVFQDPKGRNWDGKRSTWQNGQTWILGGWKNLCIYNKVKKDDTIICELLPQSKDTCKTIKVQIIKSDLSKEN